MTTLYDVNGRAVTLYDVNGRAAFGGATATEPDLRPAPKTALIAAVRPVSKPLATYVVAADGTGTHTTIQAAVNAAKVKQSAVLAAAGVSEPTPLHTVRVVVKPGTYREAMNVGGVPWLQMFGAGSATTTILPPQDGTSHRGVLEAAGRLYVEGITLHMDARPAGQTNPVYPIHTNNKGTSIYADVRFRDDVGGTNGYSFGSDGTIKGHTYLIDCGITGGVNAHGWANMIGDQAITFVNTTAGGRLGWDTLEPKSPADVWIVGGRSGSVVVKDAASRLHLDPAHTTSNITALGTRDADTRWPVPFEGLSPWDAALYGMGRAGDTPPAGTPGY